MSDSNMLISFSLLFFVISFASSSSFNATHKCSPQQALDLLLFKENMSSVSHSYDEESSIDFYCHPWLGSGYHPIMMKWNKNTDCCIWDGITCNHLTGDVISIDLSCGMLRGILHPNTTLFHLPHLQKLNLAFNDFTASQLPREIHELSNSLTHLNISSCGLVGSLPRYLVNLRHLTTLDLSYNKLNGTLPSFLFTLPLLENVILHDNMFSGGLPLELFNCRSLKILSLESNQFDGKINRGSTPLSFIQLPNLTYLDLSYNSFTGLWDLNTLLSNLPNLQFLSLSYSGLIVETNNGTSYVSPELRYLDLTSCNITMFPESLQALKLETLILNGNQLQGEVPSSLSNYRSLRVLDLGHNQLNGTFPGSLGDLPNLQVLILRSNKLQGPIESSCTSETAFPVMQVLDLSHNRFEGHFPAKYFQHSDAMKDVGVKIKRTKYLPIYKSRKYYSVFTILYLHPPFKLEYVIPGGSLTSLIVLDLSHNSLTGQIPYALQNLLKIEMLDLSSNRFTGEIPQSFADLTYLRVLDLSSNRLMGEIPQYLKDFTFLVVVNLSSNQLTRGIPQSLADLTHLEALDLSSNQLTGEIPQTLTDLIYLSILNLSQNYFVGRIPQGAQFNTFGGSSFEGNLGLCGFQLPRVCDPPSSPQLEVADGDEEESGFTWKVVTMGYGCGTLPGLLIGYVMLSTGRPKCLNKLFVAAERMIQTRKIKRRRYIFIGK